jgi:hypothetical protein
MLLLPCDGLPCSARLVYLGKPAWI